jgi:hypothetical protein
MQKERCEIFEQFVAYFDPPQSIQDIQAFA